MDSTQRKQVSLAPRPCCSVRYARRLLICLMLLAIALAGGAGNASAQESMFVLREATEGKPYDAQVAAAGTAPYTWVLLQGEIPPGLQLAADGKLTGTPTAHRATPYTLKVSVTDSSGPARVAQQWLSLEVIQLPLIASTGNVVRAPGAAAAPAQPAFVLTTSTADEETIALTQRFSAPLPTPDFQSDTAPSNLAHLQTIIGSSIGTSTRDFEEGDYCLVHVIWWKPINDEKKTELDREIWALFKSRQSSETNVVWEPLIDPKNTELFSTRIFGKKRVAVLLAHLNTPPAWDVKYKVSIKQKIPVPIQHALELASAITGGAGLDKERREKDIFGARMMLVKYTASDIIVKVNAVTGNTGRPVEQSKEHTKTFDNEGKYHWDVSVGLPVKSVRELQFKSDGNRVFAESKEKQSVYGFLNLYPKAVDLKSEDFFTVPHIVLGVPLASKPLQRPFVGVGTGLFKMPVKFNIFAGVVFLRERVPRTLGESAAATTSQLEADLHTRWVRKFMFGINLPVGQIKDAIKSK